MSFKLHLLSNRKSGVVMLRQSLQKAAVVWALLAVFILLSVVTDNFLSLENLRNILDQQSFVLIIAAFATIVMISGGFDVSLGAIYILAPIVALKIENSSGSVAKMLISGILVGLICGL